MLDRWTIALVRPPLQAAAAQLKKFGVTPDQVTVAGFVLGISAIPAIAFGHFLPALLCILLNRAADGLDGALARLGRSSDSGGYLDIVLDFIFYSGVVFAFALADPIVNGLPAAALLFAFTGTGCSFLSFAIMAERRGLKSVTYPHKGFYYLGGLAEGTETLIFFVICCLRPTYFPYFSYGFAGICLLTTVTRLIAGYRTIRWDERRIEE